MTVPAVSIIIPCHNGGRFLDALFASLSKQTFRDFEVIIVNNGSTERETLEKLASLQAVARVVHQENRYLPGARNTGFREARAAIVLPLDCDDQIEPSFLEETVCLLQSAPADVGFVYTHMRLVGMFEGVLATRFNYFDQLFINRLPYCMLFRKSVWSALGGYDETMRDGSEDWEFSIRVTRANFRGIEIPRPLFVYTVRPDGMLLSKSSRMQGTIWRQIRERNRDLYRLPALVKKWRAAHSGWGSALLAMALLAMAKVLPEAWYNVLLFRLIMFVRARRVARGALHAAPLGT